MHHRGGMVLLVQEDNHILCKLDSCRYITFLKKNTNWANENSLFLKVNFSSVVVSLNLWAKGIAICACFMLQGRAILASKQRWLWLTFLNTYCAPDTFTLITQCSLPSLPFSEVKPHHAFSEAALDHTWTQCLQRPHPSGPCGHLEYVNCDVNDTG